MAATWATADFVAMCGRTVFLPFAQIPGTVVPPAERLCGIGLECLCITIDLGQMTADECK